MFLSLPSYAPEIVEFGMPRYYLPGAVVLPRRSLVTDLKVETEHYASAQPSI